MSRKRNVTPAPSSTGESFLEISETEFRAWTNFVASISTDAVFTNLKFDPIDRAANIILSRIEFEASDILGICEIAISREFEGVTHECARVGVGPANGQLLRYSFNQNQINEGRKRKQRYLSHSAARYQVEISFRGTAPNFLGDELRAICLKMVTRTLEVAQAATSLIAENGAAAVRAAFQSHEARRTPPGTIISRVLPIVGRRGGSRITFYASCYKDEVCIEYISRVTARHPAQIAGRPDQVNQRVRRIPGLVDRLKASDRVYVPDEDAGRDIDALRVLVAAGMEGTKPAPLRDREWLLSERSDVALTAVRYKGIATGFIGQFFEANPNLVGQVQSPAVAAANGFSSLSRWVLQRRFPGMLVEPIFSSRDTRVVEGQVFLVMPFHEPWSRDVELAYREILEKKSLTVVRADDMFGQSIMEDIWRGIATSQLILVDTSGRNPNVFYELGICHVLGKPTIMTTQSTNDIPFDVRHLRHIVYENSFSGLKRLTSGLDGTLLELGVGSGS